MNLEVILKSMAEKYSMELYNKNWEAFNFKNTNLYIMRDSNQKFFYVYLYLDFFELKKFIDNLQAEIYIYLKDYFYVDSSLIYSGFEKNTTLIIFADESEYGVCDVCEYIEEDCSYFKKQVVVLSESEKMYINSICSDNFANTIDEVVVNKEEFDKFFKGNKSISYSVAAKFYEKLPFLTLNRKDSKHIDIDNILDENLNEDNKEILKVILEFDFNKEIQSAEELL